MDAERGSNRLPPLWLGHLLVFGLLFALVLTWFFVQTRQAQRLFLDDASEHARLLTDAVILHARGALMAEEMTEGLLTRSLANSARFVAYLDAIAPFRAEELSAFAAEAGLSVIRVVRSEENVQGPPDWAPSQPLDCGRLEQLIRMPSAHALVYGLAREDGDGCVLVGMDSRDSEALEDAIGLPKALESIADLPGVVSVRLEGRPRERVTQPLECSLPEVSIRQLADGLTVARATAPVAGARLFLELDAGPLILMRERLWLEFVAFMAVLVLAGGAATWILIRHQRAHERQRLDYERRLSRQREEAGLGRAAAAIAHEIRNPLNAMAMGLQRLQLEAEELSPDHRRLVELVGEAVRRTNATVTGLLDYARPVRPRQERVALDRLVEDLLSLYRQRLDDRGIRLEASLRPETWISADPDLLTQVLDNLLRNALEAQPRGGDIQVRVELDGDRARLIVANPGLELEAAEVERILEPWFTTKAEGTGLGLAISQRIVAAHGGRLEIRVPTPGRLSLSVTMPTRGTTD
ncbi:sensor histidine kinase [Imhoffiella purpurea]|uniref:histidine kinase n=1 Tax=Imhoffiella purpurea TaxID=1249627 RepID=W9VFU8_9GAMM|nr:ATP-binding protein [Imhoffiella purpurea]EXJ14907.1 multi-sensor signal transduction histidine kinase [Imhoffiella purpurea]